MLDKKLFNLIKKNQFGIIVKSSATDAYLFLEAGTNLTRDLLSIILKHRFPVNIITKSDLVLRDLDLLHEINKTAILPVDLNHRLTNKAIITFSFSTIVDNIAMIFEPGATVPSVRLNAVRTVLAEKFMSGISLMPLIPYITDTADHLEKMFSFFSNEKVKYNFPATITLFDTGTSDSKTLMFRAIDKHYPALSEKYRKLFSVSNSLPSYYNEAFTRKAKELSDKFGLRNSII